ncbi:hypothetical protein [Streptomyces niveiscabiei]
MPVSLKPGGSRNRRRRSSPSGDPAAPAGSPCRTGKGKVAIQYRTARFRLVPHLAKALSMPGPAWTELPRPVRLRDRTLEGHESARKRGKTIGGAGGMRMLREHDERSAAAAGP